MQDFQRQLDALNKLKSFLEGYCVDLDVQLGIYRGWVQNMRSEGVPTQIAGTYEVNNYVDNESFIMRTIDNIRENDLPYIKRQMDKIEDLLRS